MTVTVPNAKWCVVGPGGWHRIRLDLSDESFCKTLHKSSIHAIEIEVLGRNENGSVVLYSSVSPLADAYGGGDYEEYSAMPWFHFVTGREEDDDPPQITNAPEKFDWLPFVSIDVPRPDDSIYL